MKRYRWFFLTLMLLSARYAYAQEILVSAAASLTQVFQEIGGAFEKRNPSIKVRFNFGGSGALLQQLDRGAPVDVFASADQETMDQAQAKDLLVPNTRQNFVGNTLVLITPILGNPPLPQTLNDLIRADYPRLAMAHPLSVPAGRYAQAALVQAQIWQSLQPKMIYALHVRQALDYVARGEVSAGFVYRTDALYLNDQVRIALAVPTPQAINYPIAIVKTSTQQALAQQWIDFLATDLARTLFIKHGFAPQ